MSHVVENFTLQGRVTARDREQATEGSCCGVEVMILQQNLTIYIFVLILLDYILRACLSKHGNKKEM